MTIFKKVICTMLILSIMYLAVPSFCSADTLSSSTTSIGTVVVTSNPPGYDDD